MSEVRTWIGGHWHRYRFELLQQFSSRL